MTTVGRWTTDRRFELREEEEGFGRGGVWSEKGRSVTVGSGPVVVEDGPVTLSEDSLAVGGKKCDDGNSRKILFLV